MSVQPILDGRSWEGKDAERMVIASIRESCEHPGYYHHEIIDARAWSSVRTRRPVLASHALESLRISLDREAPGASLVWEESNAKPFDAPAVPVDKQEYVYFLQAGPFIKIGKTTGHPESRISDLQTGCPYDIRLIAHIEGGVSAEHGLHLRFASLHQRGEWFRHEGALSEYLEELCDE